MRTTLLALAAISTLGISSDVMAMWSWLSGGKKSGEKQGTEMGPLSSSVPRQPNLRTASGDARSQPTPPASRTMSTSGEDTLIFRERGSLHSESYGIPIPSKSAPGTPIQTRRIQGLKDEPTATSYAPESLLDFSNFLFEMEGLDDADPRPSASVNILGASQGSRNSKREEDEERLETKTPTSSPSKETDKFESPFFSFDEDFNVKDPNRPLLKNHKTIKSEDTHTSKLTQFGQPELIVGSPPNRTPKFRRRGAE